MELGFLSSYAPKSPSNFVRAYQYDYVRISFQLDEILMSTQIKILYFSLNLLQIGTMLTK